MSLDNISFQLLSLNIVLSPPVDTYHVIWPASIRAKFLTGSYHLKANQLTAKIYPLVYS
jgi:hypothetical protein